MASDMLVTAKIKITEIDVSKITAVLSKLKGIKIPIDTSALGDAQRKMAAMVSQTKKTTAQTAALQNQYKRFGQSARAIKNAQKNMDAFGRAAGRGGKNVMSLSDRMQEIAPRALAFRIATTLINGFVNAITDAISFIRDMDQILADVRKVSGATTAELEIMGNTIIDVASKYGLAARDVADQFKTIVQAGFEAGRAFDVVATAAEGAAATTLNFDQATELLIQTMKVFGDLEADTIFDKIAVAESSAAVTATDIQEAMKRSAATFREVNASVDDMIGLISALQETSRRGGAVVGTAFRTIATRIVAGDTAKAVEDLGVATKNADGTLRDFGELLNDIRLKFKTLTEAEKVQAGTVIAGRRQFESFFQILNSLDKAQIVSTKSAEAHGEAQQRAAIQVETINGLMNQLNNAFLAAVKGINDFGPVTDIFKTLIKLLTQFLTVADGAVAKVAALGAGFIAIKGTAKVLGPLFGGIARGVGGLTGMSRGGPSVPSGPLIVGRSEHALARKKLRPNAGIFETKELKRGFASLKSAAAGAGIAMAFMGSEIRDFGFDSKFFPDFLDDLGLSANATAQELEYARKAFEDSKGGIRRFADELVSSLGPAAMGFMIHPVVGLGTAIFQAVPKIWNAIDTFAEANKAYEVAVQSRGVPATIDITKAISNLEKEGKTAEAAILRYKNEIGKLSADLVRVKAGGDSETAESIVKAIESADIKLKFLEDAENQASNLGTHIGMIFDEFRKKAEGVEMTSGEVMDNLIKGLLADPAVENVTQAKALITSGDIFTQVMAQAGFDLESVAEGGNLLTQVVDQYNASVRKLSQTKIDISTILDSDKYMNAVHDMNVETLKMASASIVYNNSITDSIDLKREQAQLEYEIAQEAGKKQQTLFRNNLEAFTQEIGDLSGYTPASKNLFTKNLEEFFQSVSAHGQGVVDAEGSLRGLTALLEGRYVQSTEDNIELIEKLHGTWLESEKSLTKLTQAEIKRKKILDATNVEKLVQSLEKERVAKERSLQVTEASRRLLEGTDIDPNNLQEIQQVFKALADGSVETSTGMAKLLKSIDYFENPISELRQQIQNTVKAGADEIDMLKGRNDSIREEIARLKEAEDAGNRNAEISKREMEILDNEKDIMLARIDTIKEVNSQNNKLRGAEKQAAEKLADAQKKLVKSFLGLEEQMAALNKETLSAISEADADAQSDLKDAQQSVIDSTESLADAYADLVDAQLDLGDAVTGYRVGMSLAVRETDILQGRIRGFSDQMSSLKGVYEEILDTAVMTENKRLELMQELASEQLSLVESVIDETKSIGQRLFTTTAEGASDLVSGFAALRSTIEQFQGAGGFGGVDINEFGNALLNLPQATRQAMSDALSMLPETATLGGLSKEEIENILYGAAVGESEEANIQNLNDLTEQQTDLMLEIADLNRSGIITASEQLDAAQEQLSLAEDQLALDEIMLEKAEQNALDVRDDIRTAAAELSATQEQVGEIIAGGVKAATDTDMHQRAMEHASRLAELEIIGANTEGLKDAIASLKETGTTVTGLGGAARGHIPRNFASGNIAGLAAAYIREKRMGPPGSNPVIANDSEIIIPTRSKGNVKNFQGGTQAAVPIESVEMVNLLSNILDTLQAQPATEDVAATAATGVVPEQKVEATININAEQKVQVTGATDVASAVADAVKTGLNGYVTEDSMASINEAILEIFNVLRERGVVNILGQG